MSRWRRRLARLRDHPGDALLLARVIALNVVVHVLVHRIGVARTARLVRPGVRAHEGAFTRAGRALSDTASEALDSRRVRVLAEFADPSTSAWTEGACLERSLVLYRLLNRMGVPVDLMIGLRSREGEVDGHAWLAWEGRPVLENFDPRDEFLATLCFASPYRGAEVPFPQAVSHAAPSL